MSHLGHILALQARLTYLLSGTTGAQDLAADGVEVRAEFHDALLVKHGDQGSLGDDEINIRSCNGSLLTS